MKFLTKGRTLLGSSLALALIFVCLFYKATLGINFLIFNLFLVVVIFFLATTHKRLNKDIIFNLIILILLSATFGLTTAVAIRIIVFLAWMYFGAICVYSLIHSNCYFEVWRYISAPIEQGVMSLISPILAFSGRQFSQRRRKVSLLLRIGLGLAVAMPFLLLFLVLLLSGDLVFREFVNNIFSRGFLSDIVTIVILFFSSLWIFLGMFYYALVLRKSAEVKEKVRALKQRFVVESATTLVLVESLFLIYNIIQLTYLFGGKGLITKGDFTYAEYARKGFFEIIIVSTLALGLIGVLFKVKRAITRNENAMMRLLGILGLMELVPMTISAFYRLLLYEREFGFTELRIYSHIFIVFLIVLFIIFAIKILTPLRERIFLYTIELFTLSCLAIIGIINIDGIVAAFNIHRFNSNLEDSSKIDVWYLSTLSYDAVPELVELFNTTQNVSVKEETAYYLVNKYNELTSKSQDIRGFNLREHRARRLLEINYRVLYYYSQLYEQHVREKGLVPVSVD